MRCYINHIIENNDEKQEKTNLPAIYVKDESLKFNLEEEKVIIRFKKDNIIMEKDSKESNIIFDFKINKKTEGKYLIKNINFYIDTKVLTNKIIQKKDYVYIEYELWLQDEYVGIFKYQIDIKEELH